MPHGITQCYLPPGRGDIPALTPAEAGMKRGVPSTTGSSASVGGSDESKAITRARVDRPIAGVSRRRLPRDRMTDWYLEQAVRPVRRRPTVWYFTRTDGRELSRGCRAELS